MGQACSSDKATKQRKPNGKEKGKSKSRKEKKDKKERGLAAAPSMIIPLCRRGLSVPVPDECIIAVTLRALHPTIADVRSSILAVARDLPASRMPSRQTSQMPSRHGSRRQSTSGESGGKSHAFGAFGGNSPHSPYNHGTTPAASPTTTRPGGSPRPASPVLATVSQETFPAFAGAIVRGNVVLGTGKHDAEYEECFHVNLAKLPKYVTHVFATVILKSAGQKEDLALQLRPELSVQDSASGNCALLAESPGYYSPGGEVVACFYRAPVSDSSLDGSMNEPTGAAESKMGEGSKNDGAKSSHAGANEASSSWVAQWIGCGVPAETPDEMSAVCSKFVRVVDDGFLARYEGTSNFVAESVDFPTAEESDSASRSDENGKQKKAASKSDREEAFGPSSETGADDDATAAPAVRYGFEFQGQHVFCAGDDTIGDLADPFAASKRGLGASSIFSPRRRASQGGDEANAFQTPRPQSKSTAPSPTKNGGGQQDAADDSTGGKDDDEEEEVSAAMLAQRQRKRTRGQRVTVLSPEGSGDTPAKNDDDDKPASHHFDATVAMSPRPKVVVVEDPFGAAADDGDEHASSSDGDGDATKPGGGESGSRRSGGGDSSGDAALGRRSDSNDHSAKRSLARASMRRSTVTAHEAPSLADIHRRKNDANKTKAVDALLSKKRVPKANVNAAVDAAVSAGLVWHGSLVIYASKAHVVGVQATKKMEDLRSALVAFETASTSSDRRVACVNVLMEATHGPGLAQNPARILHRCVDFLECVERVDPAAVPTSELMSGFVETAVAKAGSKLKPDDALIQAIKAMGEKASEGGALDEGVGGGGGGLRAEPSQVIAFSQVV